VKNWVPQRSLRTVYNTCSSRGRNSRSRAIGGRPLDAYIASTSALNCLSAASRRRPTRPTGDPRAFVAMPKCRRTSEIVPTPLPHSIILFKAASHTFCCSC
jgi:hypothetical protein